MEERERTYWGLLPDYSEEFGEEVVKRFDQHQEAIVDSGLIARIDRSVMQYHSRGEFDDEDNTDVHYAGEKGEIVETNINEYRVLIRTKMAIALADKLRFRAQALNDDSESIRSQGLAQGLLRYYDSEARALLTMGREEVTENALVMSAGWIGAFWNRAAGQPRDIIPIEDEGEEDEAKDDDEDDAAQGSQPSLSEEGQEELYDWELEDDDEDDDEEGPGEEAPPDSVYRFTGDIEVEVFNLLQTAYEGKDPTNPDWLTVKRRTNRYQLAALLGAYGDDILDEESGFDHPWDRASTYFEEHEDYIWPLFVFFKPSPMIPDGRTAIVLPCGKVISDGPSKLHRVPVFALSSSRELIGKRLPYGNEFDALLPCGLTQDAYSALSSQIDAKTPMLDVPEGTKSSMLGMYRIFENPGTRPVQSVDAFRPDETLYRNIGVFQAAASRVAQINPSMMGTPSKYEAGSSQAFQVSQGMVQQKQFTDQLNRVMSQVASMVIEIARIHMDEGRVLSIVGERGNGRVYEFKRSQLELIQSVSVVPSDPRFDTPEGREAFADKAAEKGWVRNKDEWVTAYVTGFAGMVTSDEVDRTALIRSENEQIRAAVRDIPPHVHEQANKLLLEGRDVSEQLDVLLRPHLDPMKLPQVCMGDNHRDHYIGHSDMETDETVRKDPLTKHLLQAHNNQHLLHLTPGSAVYNYQALMASGQQPLPMASPTTGEKTVPDDRQPAGAQGLDKPQGSAPKPPSGDVGAARPGLPPAMPRPPVNPGTGDAASIQSPASAPVPPGARA